MNTFGFAFLSAALFAVGFGGTVYAVRTPGSLDFIGTPINCDPNAADCQTRLRAQGEVAFAVGKSAAGDAAMARAAIAGDLRAAFHLGWHHEEAYRRAVGKKLEAGTAPQEESTPGLAGLPRGTEFLALTKRYEEVPAGPARPLADRSLAFLWYGYAANRGFGPAMNNLGAMYQFGLMGARDRGQAQIWYQRAAARQNPVARLNDRELALRYGSECEFDPLQVFAGGLMAPPVDLEEEIIVRTRYRGRVVPGPVRGLFRMQSLSVAKSPEEMGVLDVVQIAAAGRSLDSTDLNQEWDDAEEVAAMRNQRRDCKDALGKRTASADDRAKLERLRALQDSVDAQGARVRRRH